jgi:hypothetical protein
MTQFKTWVRIFGLVKHERREGSNRLVAFDPIASIHKSDA